MAKKRRDTQGLPFREVAQFWNWLPAFRAVAEVGGINEAARLLRASPSALSRSVGLLEGALGEPLFFREGGFALTARGERLLATTREAMRQVHDGTTPEGPPTGHVTLASTTRLGFYRILPSLRAIRERWSGVDARAFSVREADVGPQLLRGHLDLVVVVGSVPPPRLQGVPLMSAAYHVYCGRRHPLFRERRPTEARVLAHAFAAPAPTGSPDPQAFDAWPTALPRRVRLACDTLEPAIDACVAGELLACLPDEIVSAMGLLPKLRALPFPALPSTPLLCVHRHPVPSPRSRPLVAEIVDVLVESGVPPPPSRARPAYRE